MPDTNAPVQQPVQGWFIPANPAAPGKPKMPLALRIVLGVAAVIAVALGSHTSADGTATIPSHTPAATTSPSTPASHAP